MPTLIVEKVVPSIRSKLSNTVLVKEYLSENSLQILELPSLRRWSSMDSTFASMLHLMLVCYMCNVH